MEKPVIAGKFFAPHMPVSFTLVVWLMMDRYAAPSWLIGVAATLMAIYWSAATWALFCCKPKTPIFKED